MKDKIRYVRYYNIVPWPFGNLRISKNVKRNTQIAIMGQKKRIKKSHEDSV